MGTAPHLQAHCRTASSRQQHHRRQGHAEDVVGHQTAPLRVAISIEILLNDNNISIKEVSGMLHTVDGQTQAL
jgi:hypothetical protein